MIPGRRMRRIPAADAAPVVSTPHFPRVGLLLSAAGLIAICAATLMPAAQSPVTTPWCLICGERGGVDAFLNTLLFLPLGAGLCLAGLPARRAIALMILFSACIETTQGVAIPGRDASIGDLLFNSLGGAAGFALLAHRNLLLWPAPRVAARLIACWSALWLAVQLVVGYALLPSLPDSTLYLQVGRTLRSEERFPGSVRGVMLGGLPLHDGPIANSAIARSSLLAGTPLLVVIRAGGATRRTAPILRIADSDRRGIVLLAQRGTSLLYTGITGADRLRLRPPMIELPLALLPAIAAGDDTTYTIGVRRDADAMVMTLANGARAAGQRVALSMALGWTLILPTQWRLTAGMVERALSYLWLAALVLPFGWWSARTTIPWVLLAITTTYVGLAVLPHTFALPATTSYEWLAALSGILLGATASLALARARDLVSARRAPVERQPHTAAASRHESATA